MKEQQVRELLNRLTNVTTMVHNDPDRALTAILEIWRLVQMRLISLLQEQLACEESMLSDTEGSIAYRYKHVHPEKEGEKSGAIDPKASEILETPIEDLCLELSVRSYNCLKGANIQTISDIVQKTEAEMLRTKGLGRGSLNEIKEILARRGLQLGVQYEGKKGKKDEQQGNAGGNT